MPKRPDDNEFYDHFGEVWIPLDPEPDWKDAVKGIIAGTIVGALMFVCSIIILVGLLG